MSIIKVGGIDPSLRATGFGIIEYSDETEVINMVHCGVIRTPQKYKKVSALLYMIEGMVEISKRKEWQECDNVVVEFPAAIYPAPTKAHMTQSDIKRQEVRNYSAGTIPPVAGIAGACIAVFQKDDRVIPVYPSKWNRTRRKADTRAILEQHLGYPSDWQWDFPCSAPHQEHAYDALGMAFWLMEEHYFQYPEE